MMTPSQVLATDQSLMTQAASTVNQGCDWNPLSGHSCESQAVGGLRNKARDLAGGAGNAWAHTGGALVNSVDDLKDWAFTHPQEFISLAITGLALTAACLAACAELIAGAAIIAEIGGADIGLAYVAACSAACPALITLGPAALAFGAAALKAVTMDPGFDNFDVPNVDPGDPPAPRYKRH